MSVKCPKCSSDNPNTQSFCGNCGTQLIASDAQEMSFTKTLLTPTEDLTQGTLFAGRYEIIEELGKGGMGKVYKARDNEINEEVAIKLLKPEIAADEKILERFRNELKIARKIAHENVCRTFHFSKEEGTPYITMEYVPGDDLKSQINKKGKLSKERVLSIGKQVCAGLAVAHRLGVVHRDLKPQNIMIDEGGNAKIMDFGIARSVEAEGVTEAGMIIGTPDYISPEQAEGKKADQRSDIYSLGVILYEMVTGRVPFEGDTAFSIALKHKSQLPLHPKKLNPEVSDDLSRVILICMEKDRERRYQTAEALLDDLRNVEEGLPLGTKIQPRRETLTRKLIRRGILIPASVFIIAIIAAVIWKLLPQGEAILIPKIENSVAIISFTNLTGEKDLDVWRRGIPELLITNLENTGYFRVTTWERMLDILKQMGNKDVETIDSDLGFELCRRGGIESLVTGTLTKAGDMFALDVRVLDAETKKLRKSAGSRGEGVASIIKTQVDDLSRAIAEGLSTNGEKIEQSQFQVAEMTTTSPEAYRLFIIGKEHTSKVDFEKAAEYLERAVQIDPEFAVAYMVLSGAYFMSGKHNQGRKALTKAMELSRIASEKERLWIEQSYAWWVERDFKKSKTIAEEIVKKYPDDKQGHFHLGYALEQQGRFADAVREYQEVLRLDPNSGGAFNGLGLAYANLGEFEKAIEALKKYIALTPGEPNPWDSLSVVYIRMGKIDEAIASYKEALKIKPDFEISNMTISYLYAFKEDYPAALDSIDRYLSLDLSPERRADASLWKGFCFYWLGRFSESLEVFQQAEEASRTADWLFKPALFLLRFMLYFDREEFEAARQSVQRYVDYCVEQNPKREVRFITFGDFLRGLCNVKEGRLDLARMELGEMKSALEDLSGRDKENLMENISILQAEIDLTEGSIKEAMVSLEKIVPSSGFQPNQPFNFYILMNRNWSQYKEQRARIYAISDDLDRAITEYEGLVSPDPTKTNALIHPLYHYSLGKLYAEKGWQDKAKAQYEKFLQLWKDADEGLPEVEDARRRLAGLKSR
jgi:serine/threonine protein kinase/tetratricopeptide (TPR) repeat protein